MLATNILLLLGLSILLSWWDVRSKEVPALAVIAYAILAVYQSMETDLWETTYFSFLILGAISLLILSFYFVNRRGEGMGVGDALLLAFSGWWLLPLSLPYYLAVVGFLGIATALWWRFYYYEKTFPFAPAICGGLLLTLWINWGVP